MYVLLGESKLMASFWEMQDILIQGCFSERQTDYINYWMHECYFGEEERAWTEDDGKKIIYTGKDIKKVYKQLQEI